MYIQFSKEWVCHYSYVEQILTCILSETGADLEPSSGKGPASRVFEEEERGVMGRAPMERGTSEWLTQPPQNTTDRWQISTRILFLDTSSSPNDRYFPFSSPYLNVQPEEDIFQHVTFRWSS